MKTNIASIWIVGLVVTFIMIFSAYIIITVDYSSTFKMKNEVLNILEKNKGFTIYSGTDIKSVVTGEYVRAKVGSLRTINAYLSGSSYNAKGICAKERNTDVWIGVKTLNFSSSTASSYLDYNAEDDEEFFYCVARFGTGRDKEIYNSVYYQVQLFYRFEIPVLRELIPVRVEGTTDEVYLPSNDDLLKDYQNLPLYG